LAGRQDWLVREIGYRDFCGVEIAATGGATLGIAPGGLPNVFSSLYFRGLRVFAVGVRFALVILWIRAFWRLGGSLVRAMHLFHKGVPG
jgi:hypothetical protein